jgi:hypothetical protein
VKTTSICLMGINRASSSMDREAMEVFDE